MILSFVWGESFREACMNSKSSLACGCMSMGSLCNGCVTKSWACAEVVPIAKWLMSEGVGNGVLLVWGS